MKFVNWITASHWYRWPQITQYSFKTYTKQINSATDKTDTDDTYAHRYTMTLEALPLKTIRCQLP